MTDFVDAAQAAQMSGLRLAVTRFIPGPWSESAKGILHVKNIDHVRVSQHGGEANQALVSWLGINTAPIAVFNNEPPRTGWVEILMLAERLQPEPPLVPRDERQRAQMFGLANELCGEDGYGWNRRLMFFSNWHNALAPDNAVALESYQRMSTKYGYGGNLDHARARIVAILGLLSEQLLAQRNSGSRYYVGHNLSAVDIYAACFMAMVQPLPIELCPTSPEMHAGYAERDPAILAAADPILLAHRDFIYATHLEMPLRL